MARIARRKEMSGIFDLFKGKKKSEQKSLIDVFGKAQLPAVAPQELIQQQKPKPSSPIDVFRSKPQLPAQREPARRAALPEVFVPKPPSAVAPTKPREWTSVVPVQPEAPSKPVSEAVREAFRQEQPEAPKYVFVRPSAPPEIQAKRKYEMIVSPQQRLDWQLPTVEQLAEHFKRTNSLDDMWNFIRQVRSDPEFKKEQLASSWRGVPMIVPLDPVVYREKFTDFANFYGIPWAVMETYLNVPPEQEKAAEDALFAEVISPLNVLVPEAFEMLKPKDLPGFFNISFMEPGGQYYLFYIEPLLGIGGQGAA